MANNQTAKRYLIDRYRFREIARTMGHISDGLVGEHVGKSRRSICSYWNDGWPEEEALGLASMLSNSSSPSREELFAIIELISVPGAHDGEQ